MKKLRLYFVMLFTAALLVSCQKELSIDGIIQAPGGGGGNNASLIGTWKFLELSAKTQSDVRVTAAGITDRALTVSDYTTTNNEGSVIFDQTHMTIAGMKYDIDSELTTYIYSGATIEDSVVMPFVFSLPPYNGKSTYKVIGSDSIYFESGAIEIPNTNPQAANPAGGKFKINGNILTLTISAQETQTQSSSGVTTISINRVTSSLKLQKN